jgi:hypothetical protein
MQEGRVGAGRQKGKTMIDDNYTFEEFVRLWRDNIRRWLDKPPAGSTEAERHRHDGRLKVLDAVYERFIEQEVAHRTLAAREGAA